MSQLGVGLFLLYFSHLHWFWLAESFFPHSSWYGVVFWICARNGVDNTCMISVSLSSACTVRAFSASQSTREQAEAHKDLGGDTAKTADPE